MKFEVIIDIDEITYINSLDEKNKRIIKAHLKTLENDPFPGKGGDKELFESLPKYQDISAPHCTLIHRIL